MRQVLQSATIITKCDSTRLLLGSAAAEFPELSDHRSANNGQSQAVDKGI